MAQIYRGWISGTKDDVEVLKELGVTVGPWVEELRAWTPCDVTAAALQRLDRMWGRFIWGLNVVETSEEKPT